MSGDRLVVYTAIVGGYDDLKPVRPKWRPRNADFVCFTDTEVDPTGFWQIRPLPDLSLVDPTRIARYLKLHPHLLFPQHDVSVWVDGSLRIVASMERLVSECLTHHDLALYHHAKRSCLFDAAQKCIEMGRDDPELIRRQVDAYRLSGFRPGFGLWATGALARRHADPRVRELMGRWWREIERFSLRDQISFPYVCSEMHMQFSTIPGRIGDRNFFARTGHRKPGAQDAT